MVTCNLFGELGNQLYQIATTIAYSKKHNMNYAIPTTAKNRANNATFPLKNVVYGNYENDFPVYRDDESQLNEIPYLENICLHGYFQALPFFIDYWKEITDIFGFEWEMLKGKVSIHQRRTDYLQHPDSFPSVSLDYVHRSINHFKELGYKDFTVFSDDIEWCKENIKSDDVNIEFSEGRKPLEDMIYMSKHEHNIVANSTFSTWGAMLNQNPNKIVIRPPFFLGEKGKHLYRDIYPKEWIIKEN